MKVIGSQKVIESQNLNSNISFPEQVRRGELLDADCPSREILKRVTSRWGVLVLIALSNETLRFSALRRKIGGVSEKMLAQTLQHLEEDGFVDRIAYPVVPPHVEYKLTLLGREIQEQVEGLTVWLEANLYRIMEQRQQRSESSPTAADAAE
ncbi:transcriptional regulator [Yersinia enterocolitica]|nr:transcriptional regulator [Yersinia enterocolitica]